MHLAYFTEQPMSAYPEEEGRKAGHTALMFSNRFYDRDAASELYQDRIAEYKLVEEVGFDGIMLNEHHNAPFCMQSKCNIFASILAAITERVKIVLLGNPLPLSENPVRLAEELAMIDLVSKGRLVSGFVRGGGTEQLAIGVNPAYNRERFEEAHDLIVKTWTEPGPWRWEGAHYQNRVVNPWALPLQRPHPRVWVPGIASRETVVWAARHEYPYVCLNTTIEDTLKVWKLYNEAAADVGFEPGPQHRGYLLRVHCADTEEKALENARQFTWMQGEFTGLAHPVWSAPAGYNPPKQRKILAEIAHGRRTARRDVSFEQQVENRRIIAGTPDQVIKQLHVIMEATRPGIFMIWGNDGFVTHEDSKRCIELLGREVLPAVREIADELGLDSPFDVDAPVSHAAAQGGLQPAARA
jgi:alkanesulfonate monooxygenase SsuD/methylene tetrahydromethanopterin reductase-like flavin-dependent oxidoreductase (luciferase family)